MRRPSHPELRNRSGDARAQGRLVSEMVRTPPPAPRGIRRARAQSLEQGGAISIASRRFELESGRRNLPEIRVLPVATGLRRRLADALLLRLGPRDRRRRLRDRTPSL